MTKAEQREIDRGEEGAKRHAVVHEAQKRLHYGTEQATDERKEREHLLDFGGAQAALLE